MVLIIVGRGANPLVQIVIAPPTSGTLDSHF